MGRIKIPNMSSIDKMKVGKTGGTLVGAEKKLAVKQLILVGEGVKRIKWKGKRKKEVWRLAGIYALGDVEEKIEQIKDWMEIGE